MVNQTTTYKGFVLTAQALRMAQGFAPRIIITSHNGSETTEQIFDLPISLNAPLDEAQAVQAAIDYGKAAIDGNIAGADVSKKY